MCFLLGFRAWWQGRPRGATQLDPSGAQIAHVRPWAALSPGARDEPRHATTERQECDAHGSWIALALMVWPVVSSLAAATHGGTARRDASAVLAASRSSRLADLQIPSATVKLAVGEPRRAALPVENLGAVRARSSTAGVAWKTADSSGLIQLGKFRVPALKPGQRHKAHLQIPTPKDSHAGVYTVSVCADVLGQVQESDKKNRCHKAGTVTVGGSGVKAFGPTGPSPTPGSPPGGFLAGARITPSGLGLPASSPPGTDDRQRPVRRG